MGEEYPGRILAPAALMSCPSLEKKQVKGRTFVEPTMKIESLLLQLEEMLWEAVATSTRTSGPENLPASLLPNGLGGEGDGPGSGGGCVVRGSPGNG